MNSIKFSSIVKICTTCLIALGCATESSSTPPPPAVNDSSPAPAASVEQDSTPCSVGAELGAKHEAPKPPVDSPIPAYVPETSDYAAKKAAAAAQDAPGVEKYEASPATVQAQRQLEVEAKRLQQQYRGVEFDQQYAALKERLISP